MKTIPKIINLDNEIKQEYLDLLYLNNYSKLEKKIDQKDAP